MTKHQINATNASVVFKIQLTHKSSTDRKKSVSIHFSTRSQYIMCHREIFVFYHNIPVLTLCALTNRLDFIKTTAQIHKTKDTSTDCRKTLRKSINRYHRNPFREMVTSLPPYSYSTVTLRCPPSSFQSSHWSIGRRVHTKQHD